MNKFLNIRKDNRGATMVIVLISIMFITILGAILLFTAYTGFQVKVSQAVGENRFYDAETAMDEVAAGLQAILSDNVASTFTDLMISFDGDYSKLDEAFIDQFEITFLDSTAGLFTYTGDFADHFNAINGYTGGVKFNLGALSSFITPPPAGSGESVSLTISGDPAATEGDVDFIGSWSVSENKFIIETIVLKGLRVEHTTDNGNGYLSIVDTDIMLDIPNFNSTLSMISLGVIADFTIIATGVMDSEAAATDIDIDGNIYVGSIELIGGGTATVTLQNGRLLISGGNGLDPDSGPNGNISVVSRELVTLENTSVWARNIKVGRTTAGDTLIGTVNFRGNTNIAGSLILDGTRIIDEDTIIGSTANLSGQFRGFGTGKPHPNDPPSTPLTPENSSSIIVNGRHSRLDLSGLSNLFLAGQTFIQAVGTDVMTGQSIAVRSDQLAYLIPPALMDFPQALNAVTNTNTNPIIIPDISVLDASTDLTPDIDYNEPLWEGSARTLSDYVTPGPNSYHSVLYSVPGDSPTRVLFVFLQFNDINSANEYFYDYFQNNPDEINDYIDIYMRWYRAAADVQSTGVTYLGPNADGFNVLPSQTGPMSALRFYNEYESRRRTLTRDGTYDFSAYPDENPFHFVIRSQPPAGTYVFGGDVTAYVHHGPGALSLSSLGITLSDPDLQKLSIIVSYDEVIVDIPFEGLILCDANIDLRSSIEATGSQALRSALLAEDASGNRLGDYFNILMSDDSDYEKGETWNFNQLVYYDNWKKE